MKLITDAEIRLVVALETERGVRSYRIIRSHVIDIRQHDLEIFPDGEDALVLVTCYPFDAVNPNGPLRLVVTAEGLKS